MSKRNHNRKSGRSGGHGKPPRKPGDSFGFDKWPDWMFGKIPWSLEGLLDVIAFEEKLHDTPKDDWDLDERKIAIDWGAEKGVETYAMNQMHPMNQIGQYIVRKYRTDAPVPFRSDPGAAHGFRYMQIKEFFSDHMESLIRDGLAMRDGKDVSISHGVLHAVAVLPYSKLGKRNGQDNAEYSYEEVCRVAREYNEAHPD